tara:strand:+ start:21560 stop:21898 length:339 start_codon:yes stop_codon:yes gene_type:complete
LVGIVSTGVHVAVAFLLLNLFGVSLLASNLGAFSVAIFVSYFGNALWSFETKGELVSLGKFAVASSVTLTLIVLISNAVNLLRLPPYTGILMVAVIIPLVGFVLQKLWVFNR